MPAAMSDQPVPGATLIEFRKFKDYRGNLTPIEGGLHVPFEIKRVFYVYDIPGGEARGAHAHRELHQVLICLSGGLDVHLDDGRGTRTVHLNRPWIGLHIPPMTWASEGNFDTGTVYLVLASAPYDEKDYLRDHDEFLRLARGGAR
jgi:dTDP-4-dehydrorhamnose 3,5-epimerase-like enzyme